MIEQTVYGLSNEQYHHGEEERQYLSSSLLKKYLISPRAYKHFIDNPEEEKSDALRFGSLFHDLMANLAEHKGDWDKGFARWKDGLVTFEPPVNPKTGAAYGALTKVYREAYEEFMAGMLDRTIASEADMDRVGDMAHSLLNCCGATSVQVRKLLKWAKATEVSYFYETEDGIKLKVRPDLLTANKLVDWKTTALDTLDEDSIVKSILRYGYHISLSMYQWTIYQIEKKWYAPLLIFIQKQPPFDAIVVDISEWCYDYSPDEDYVKPGVGALEFRRLLDLHAECVRNNEWPGAEIAIEADGNVRIMKPRIPAWYGMRILND